MTVMTETRTADRPGVNRIGLEKNDYRGRPTTLCQGCRHNSISSQIIAAAFEVDLAPVVLIGLKDSKAVGLDCGACGYSDCKSFEQQAKKEREFSGPVCAFRLLDMGIALARP